MQTDTAPVVAPSSPVKRTLDNGVATETSTADMNASNAPSAGTQAEGDDAEHRQKRAKTDADAVVPTKREKIHGIAMIKEE